MDGLRSVAVYLVVLFHAGSSRFAAGHIGVDVFFVLSGYLVTGVLLRELAPDGPGRVRFGTFYARRARRLLPAALVCLLVTAIAYRSVASTVEVADASRGFQAAAVYLTNWYLIDNATSYFAVDTAHSPILHFWSLAVEEQFYLVWPLLFAGLTAATRRLGRWRWWALRAIVVVAGLASLVWALSLRATDADRAYYGTDTRAYQLLLGVLLALTPGAIARLRRLGFANAVLAAGGLGGLFAISLWGNRTGPIARGAAAALATVALLAALETGRAGLPARLLAWRPIAYLGEISYATYLWHWPVIVIASLQDPGLSPLALAGLSSLVATGLAALSNELLERPVRTTRRLNPHPWAVAGTGLALSIVAGVLVLPRSLDRPAAAQAAATVDTSAAYTPMPASFDAAAVHAGGFGRAPICEGPPIDDCTLTTGDNGTLVLVGDSNAWMWVPAFVDAAERLDLELIVLAAGGCPWQRDVKPLNRRPHERCVEMKEANYDDVLPDLHPDVLVLVNTRGWQGTGMEPTGTIAEAHLRNQTDETVRALSEVTDHLMIIEHAPRPTEEIEPLDCLAEAEVVEACRFVVPDRPDWLELQLRGLAEEIDDVTTADFDRLICPFSPICDAMVGEIAVFYDDAHITSYWAETLGDDVAEHLVATGLVDPP